MTDPKLPTGETRSIEQVREHYEIEKELARKLLRADKEERKRLYSVVYDELSDRVPFHPMHTSKSSSDDRRDSVMVRMKLVSKFLRKDSVFLELGPGDCQLSFEVARHVKKVYAVDVSNKFTRHTALPDNFQLIISDGTSVDVPSGSVNLAYSDQLMEHLHPDDAKDQLLEIHKALVPGGTYICMTPHRFMGPGDVSQYFDEVATGFHLKEYTNTELVRLFRSVGFSKVRNYFGVKNRYYTGFPVQLALGIEYLISRLPYSLRKNIATAPVIRNFLYIQLIATK